MYDPSVAQITQRFALLLSTTQRGLLRNCKRADADSIPLNDQELYRLAFIMPIGRQDIRRFAGLSDPPFGPGRGRGMKVSSNALTETMSPMSRRARSAMCEPESPRAPFARRRSKRHK